ncbi:hypothetical protein [Amycolatopsis suaedae]|uniref:Uncharacterized protein n=1 Tax=Amycolatopsis suaedae TaxID=2510978 RepID=A0A4Q7J570_9PSEU|nr:hypothetical protein [Amycolatopsis suaedae]RZQ61978.1 hypothetical protein EWH70_20445 [Amycolatopsis suaedae]
MKDEMSVDELLEREGWVQHVPPPPPRSRWRVFAVMAAVVLGCGVAALVVRGGPSEPLAEPAPQGIDIIKYPWQPTGVAGPDATAVTEEPGGAGGDSGFEILPTEEETTSSRTSRTTTPPPDTGEETTSEPSSSNPGGQPPTSSSSQRPTTTTTSKKPCLLPPLIC